MPTRIPSTGTIARACRLLPATIALALLVLLGFVPTGLAQQPLSFGNNFFVTGDYVVAGAYGMNSGTVTMNKVTYAKGTINVPDTPNKGLSGTNQVPAGAQIVKALLYWQTVENTGVASGQNGFFQPIFNGGPQTAYAISGVTAGQVKSWAPSGCSSSGTGKQLSTYRAEVTNLLPQDANGNVIADGQYQVLLPSNGIFNHQPFTLGATLVIIFRVLSPDYPLNSIVIYDGAFAPAKTSQTVTQSVQGFYDAEVSAAGSFSRLTYILGNVQQSLNEAVHFNSQPLPLLYGGQTAFPSHYVNWDTVTWTFDDPNNPLLAHFGNPLTEGASSATTQIVPGSTNNGCTSLAAVVVSTTVKNSDNDGLLDSWKTNQGYCDASINEASTKTPKASCTAAGSQWVDLTGATSGQKDVFIQLDYMCSVVTGVDSCNTSPGNDVFDPRLPVDPLTGKSAIDKVVDAYKPQGIHLHINPTAGAVHAIPEPTCVDSSNDSYCTSLASNGLAPFPDQPGVVAWKGPFLVLKNQLVDPDDASVTDCAGNNPEADCIPRFNPAQKDSYHYSLWAHTLAIPNWTLLGGSLMATQHTQTVTFTTSTAHGLAPDPNCKGDNNGLGRVTIAYAITNPGLNGTYCVQTVPSSTTFTVQVAAANSATATYTPFTDPDFAVFSGNALASGTVSGFSDIGGADSLITLGSWGANGQTWQIKAGTFMHELGHSNGLTHGGFYFDKLTANNKNYTATIEGNCKSNFQSVMTYEGQLLLLNTGLFDINGKPIRTVDYSGQYLDTIDEGVTKSAPFFTTTPTYPYTFWYKPWVGPPSHPEQGKQPAAGHCDGTSAPPLPQMFQFEGTTLTFAWSANQDLNYDGVTETIGSPASAPFGLRGHNDWHDTLTNGVVTAPGINLQQVSAAGSQSSSGGKGFGGGGGGKGFGGGGGGKGFGGGGGGKGFGGGGGGKGFGGGGGAGELNVETANAQTFPPQVLTASENNSARFITLNWAAPAFGQIVQYNIYRSDDGGNTFNNIGHVSGTPPATTFTDTDQCNPAPLGHQYFVTAVINNPGPQEGPGSNTVSTSGQTGVLLTGCYTNNPPADVINNLSVPNTQFVQGVGTVPITWSLQDDDTGAVVNNTTANTLTAYGPFPSDQTCPAGLPANAPSTLLLSNGVAQGGAGSFGFSGGVFTFNWNTTNFNAGCYFFKLTLDSGQFETTQTALTLLIFVSDSSPHVVTTTVPNGVVGSAYPSIPVSPPLSSATLQEAGGVAPFTWVVVAPPAGTGTLPSGISLSPSGTLTGTTCQKGNYNFTAKVTDSLGNFGMQNLMLTVLPAPVAQVNQPTAPESSVPGAGQFALTLNGTGFNACSSVLWNGASFAPTSQSATQLTATIPATDVAAAGTASISVSNTGSPTSNVDFFQITNSTGNIVFLSPAGPATSVGGGSQPNGVISGDFNSDGKQDMAVANFGNNNVSILLGNGDGTFSSAGPYPAGSGATALAVGDFNNDGKLDLAVANVGDDSVSVLLGKGDGTFPTSVPYAAGSGPTSVVAGDFNGDGSLDLAVADSGSNTVSILLGNGDGTFQAAATYPAGSGPSSVVTGDFNRDGKLDLAVTNPSAGQVSILLGNGEGTFQTPVSYNTEAGGNALAVTAADFTGTGILDLAVTSVNANPGQGNTANTVSIFLGKGDGTFTLNASYPATMGLSKSPSAITSGDFNGDGVVDLAITDTGDNSVSVLVGNGDGTFQSPLEYQVGSSAAGVAAGDFNGDGRLDVAVANTTDGTVSMMLQAPHVKLTPSPSLPSFGTVAVTSSSAPQVVTLTNDGSAALKITNIAVGGTNINDFTFSSQGNTACPMSPNTLAAGSSCTISVIFKPTQAGARSASLSITDNATGSPQSVSLSGTGILASPTSLTASATAGSGSVSLNWTASTSSTVTGYKVYRGTTSGGETFLVSVGATNYTDTVASGTYFYVVTAVDASSNESANSNEVSATD